MKKITHFLIISVAIFTLFSCANEANNSEEFTINTTLIADDYLFEGSNTCQAEISAGIKKFISDNNIKEEQIVDVKLKSATIKNDTVGSSNIIESVNLQIFSDNFPMQNVAVANPVPNNVEEITFKVAEIQEDIKSILFEDKSYVVADVTIKEDIEDGLELNTSLVFSINYYKK